LRFEPTVEPEFRLANGWTPPPTSSPENLPFQVYRTEKGRYLPVYATYKNARTRALTVVRNIDGDVTCLRDELAKVKTKNPSARGVLFSNEVLERWKLNAQNCMYRLKHVVHVGSSRWQVCAENGKLAAVSQRAGKLEVKGHHTASVRNYLVGLGF
jgi:hypothetical protein